MRESEVVSALFEHFRREDRVEWACFDHLRLGTGFQGKADQVIDFFAMNCWHSHRYKTIAFEIKISRGDFQRELRLPLKRLAACTICDEFVFAAPKGLIQTNELPEECGLWEIADGIVAQKVPAKIRPVGKLVAPSWPFIASILRRQAIAEGKERSVPIDFVGVNGSQQTLEEHEEKEERERLNA